MTKDLLFLLPPDFYDAGKPYYCPDCATVTGLLTMYPVLKDRHDIRYADYPRPRPEIVALLGEAHQNCPMLVLAQTPRMDAPADTVQQAGTRWFVTGANAIGRYWAYAHGIGEPH
jgi:hypothetical protein